MLKKFFQWVREHFPHDLMFPQQYFLVERGHILKISFTDGTSRRYKVLGKHTAVGSFGGTFTKLRVRKLLW